MKKLSIIFIAVILLLTSVLNGCVSNTDNSGADQTSGQTSEQASEAAEESKAEELNFFDYAFAVENNALVSRMVDFGMSSEDALAKLGLTEDAMLIDDYFALRRITRTVEGDGYMNGMTEMFNFHSNKMNSAAYVITVAPDELESVTLELAALVGGKLPADWTQSDTTKFSRRYSWKDPAGTKLDILIPKNPNADGMNEINISLTPDTGK